MKSLSPPDPLSIARSLGVPLVEVAGRLGISTNWLRQMARNPRHGRRIRIAELEAVLEQQRLELSVESLIRSHP